MPRRIFTILLLWLLTGAAVAHELQANRLTLAMRSPNHVSLVFIVDYAAALHRALAPGATFQQFVLTYAAMSPQDFQREVLRAQASFEGSTRLTLPSGKDVTIANWKWPEAGKVQAAFQQRAMQSIVAPGAHAHDDLLEIRADATSAQDLGKVAVRLPEEFQQVLLVSYRPHQVWVDAAAEAVVEF